MSTTIVTSANAAPGLGSAITVELLDPANANVVHPASNTGIREDAPGFYVFSGTVTQDLDDVEAIWSDGTTERGEVIHKSSATVINPVLTTPSSGATGPGTTHVIKRGDSLPQLVYQCTRNGVPVDLTGCTGLFKMRASPDAGIQLISRACGFGDRTQGIVTFNFLSSETATSGEYDGEFEIVFPGGAKETFPTTDPDLDAAHEYLTIKIPKDLD